MIFVTLMEPKKKQSKIYSESGALFFYSCNTGYFAQHALHVPFLFLFVMFGFVICLFISFCQINMKTKYIF